MPHAKVAITLPEEILAKVDAAAEERGESRSGFIQRVLATALAARRDAGITRQLNELFSSKELLVEQTRTAGSLDAEGTDWTDENW